MGRSTRLPNFFRKIAVAACGATAILCFAGFGMDGPQSTIAVEGPVAQNQLDLFYVTLWVTLFIFITVGGALAYAQIRFRARATDDNREPPPQTHGHPAAEVGLIIASTLLLVIIAVPTVKGIWYTADVPDRKDALVVKVTGYQWWFKFEYPDLGVVTANEMVIPTDRPVHIELRTIDVIHSFWVPKLAGKVDLMPNRANHMWLQADKANYYWAQCAEYCGESHANMRFRVVSLEASEFQSWVDRQTAAARNVPAAAAGDTSLQPRVQFVADRNEDDFGMGGAESPFAFWQYKQVIPDGAIEDPALIARGKQLFETKTCASCHTIVGHKDSHGNDFGGISGPTLTHFGSRTTIAAALLDNTRANLHRWLDDPNGVKPGNIMWRTGGIGDPARIKLKRDEIDALVAYLSSLK